MNWGKALTIALIVFATMMAGFIITAARNPEPLVAEDYYVQELRFQERIDEAARARALSAPVRIVLARGGVRVSFPADVQGDEITGKLVLQRPNDPAADRSLEVTADGDGVFSSGDVGLLPGRYNASLHWTAGGVRYFTREEVHAE